MNDLSVFDLDKTLIRCESIQYLMLRHPKMGLLPLIACRLIGGINAADFAAGISNLYAREFSDSAWVERFCSALLKYMDPNIQNLLQSASGTKILVSASPQAYVGPLAARLGMVGHGSDFDAHGRFFHYKGEGKLAVLTQLYPQDRFTWHMAVSDAKSDISLLKCFKIGYLYTHNKLQRIGL